MGWVKRSAQMTFGGVWHTLHLKASFCCRVGMANLAQLAKSAAIAPLLTALNGHDQLG
ncbi:MAG TPA: hypothetical protein IGS37_04355 [Synechococcales cyanobacterium M55_K2018_004]|nr:hypothetical protein [Synechococcales cyanobacterium M55_K2018_004]